MVHFSSFVDTKFLTRLTSDYARAIVNAGLRA